jgi:hypothetical protein
MEEGKLVSLAVGAEATKERENEKYIPLHFAFANRGAPTLTLRRESFILQDENGKRYPLASLQEVNAAYGPSLMDRRFTTTFDMFRSRLSTFELVDSNFFLRRPAAGSSSIGWSCPASTTSWIFCTSRIPTTRSWAALRAAREAERHRGRVLRQVPRGLTGRSACPRPSSPG